MQPLMNTPPIINPNGIDLVVPTRRDPEFAIELMKNAGENPFWQQHTMLFVFDQDTTEVEDDFRAWVRKAREDLPLPWVLTTTAEPEARQNLAALRQQGVGMGVNPFVYFQDDDDPLPSGMPRRIDLMQSQGWDAVYGAVETVTSRGQMIERFPGINGSGQFAYDPVAGSRWFPTYLHPLAALFKRSVFEAVPYFDGNAYKMCDNAAFFTRLLFSGAKVTALPDIVRRAVQHDDNISEPILNGWQRENLVHDMKVWRACITDPAVAEFQDDVAAQLQDGLLSTFKEIDALVEGKIEGF